MYIFCRAFRNNSSCENADLFANAYFYGNMLVRLSLLSPFLAGTRGERSASVVRLKSARFLIRKGDE